MIRLVGTSACGLTLAFVCLAAGSAPAQEAVLSQFYGSGVHSYYERDYAQAMADLSQAIDGGTRDPRAYYYRGLAHQRMGNASAAQHDMLKGAELENADVNQFYPVGRSLERVQGAQRQQLERYRAVARAQTHERQMRRDAVRYEQLRRSETQVLRAVPLGPLPAPLRPPVVAPPAPAVPVPAVAAPGGAVPPAGVEPAAPAEPAEASPFDETPADAPAEPPAEMPAEEEPAAEPPAAEPPPTPEPPTPEPPPAAEPPAAEAPPAAEPKDDNLFEENDPK